MVKPIYLAFGAIPVIVALLISVPLLTKNEIPISAANPTDIIEIEYTKHQLKKIDYGVTERVGAQKTEILFIKNDGELKYSVTEQGYLQPDIRSKLDEAKLNKIKALIKETGFIAIPSESFPVLENVTEFQKSNVKVTLNGRVNQIHWPEQSATSGFIPPIITMVESELDQIISDIREQVQIASSENQNMLPLSGERNDAKGIISEKSNSADILRGSSTLKRGFAHMLKNGVVMDVTTVEQAQIAEEAGAVSVMVLDKLPSEVRKAGGVARTASIRIIEDIMDSVTIPVMAKCRIGHVNEALVLQETDVDMIDESEVLTPADESHHIWKWDFTTPFVNGARSLSEALRRIEEGAAMIRTKGEPGTGNVAEAVTHIKKVNDELRTIKAIYDSGDNQDLVRMAREFKVSYDVVEQTAKLGRLPVVNFAAGGIATPADAAYLMSLGCDGIFVGSGIFNANDAKERARAIVLATTFWNESEKVKEAQKMIDERQSMLGLDVNTLELRMQERGGSA